jgi:hypothetical protein
MELKYISISIIMLDLLFYLAHHSLVDGFCPICSTGTSGYLGLLEDNNKYNPETIGQRNTTIRPPKNTQIGINTN